jgi:putative peptide zinc metalloprotease protein
MSHAFFSQTWYRVATLRPRVLEHVRVERHRYGRQAWYALHDPLAGRVHRVTPAAYLFVVRMDGVRTIDDIWQELVAEMDTEAPGQEAVVSLLMQLHSADMLAGDIPPDAAELLSRRDRQARSVWMRNLRSPLSMQFPLIDPDRFLTRTLSFAAPLMTWFALAAWVVLLGAGLMTVGRHWAELSENVLDKVLASEGLLALALCYPVVKTLHELGHGYAAKRLGCEVHEMGVMLLVLFPVPYVDASNSAALKSKWQRAGVAAAGIMVELALAAVAALVWAAAEPGVVRAIAYNVMLIGGVSTVLVNGNPLLRFDGYYVLADVLEVPNLGQRSIRYLGHLMNRFAFGVPGMRAFSASTFERIVMLIYAPLAWCYRIAMTAGVALFVAERYFILGVMAAIVSVTMAFIWPMTKALWRVGTSPQHRGRRLRASGLTFGGIALAAMLVLLVPAPLHSNAEGVIWLPEESAVRAGTDGFVRQVDAAPGATVAQGAPLFTLVHPLALARLQITEARVDELAAKYASEWVTDRVTAEVTRFELVQEQAVMTRERVRIGRHAILSPAAGVFHPLRPAEDIEGRYVKEGDIVGYVTPQAGQTARVVVPQADIGLMGSRLTGVQVRLADRKTDLASSIVRAVPAGRDDLPNQALSRANGGEISADPRDQKGTRTFERLFQFDVALPDDPAVAQAGFGSRVYVRFIYAWEPVGEMLFRRVRQALLSRFDA